MDRSQIAGRIGATYRSLESASQTQTSIHDLPPSGVARLLRREGEWLFWQPVSPSEWDELTDEERGELILQKAEVWLSENADIAVSPVALLDARAATAAEGQLFGMRINTLRQAICATYHAM